MHDLSMINKVKYKLQISLRKKLKVNDEAQVVYIISLIRKIIEIERTQVQYKTLKAYSDWALHSKNDSNKGIQDILNDFVEVRENRQNFLKILISSKLSLNCS